MIYTVNVNGKPIKSFTDKAAANKFMIWYTQDMTLQDLRFKLLEEAVEKSEMKDAKELLKYIMEKKSEK
jgi:hypothetical protein